MADFCQWQHLIIEATIAELKTFKATALHSLWDILDRTLTEIETDLTPDQKAEWSRIKPKRPEELK